MMWAGLGTASLLAAGLYLVRRWRSARWGRLTSAARLTGRVVVVTGANTGLGSHAAEELVRRGAIVVLACRNRDNTAATLTKLQRLPGPGTAEFLQLDLSSLASVRLAATELLDRHPAIHALVCNAGVWHPMEQAARTQDGLEAHAGINHLGHFLLTALLLDRLAESAPARVVVVSSSLQSQGKLDLTGTDHFKAGRQPEPGSRSFAPTGYCDSKLMNALFTKELAGRTAGRGVTAVCLCPGWCYTQLARHTNIPTYKKLLFLPIAFMFMRSGARGAENIVQAVVEDEQQLVSGGFYRECKLAAEEEVKLTAMAETGRQLWDISERLTGLQ